MIDIADIDVSKACLAMGLDTVSEIREDPWVHVAATLVYEPIILISRANLLDGYTSANAAVRTALGWSDARPHADFVRWVIGHELGHQLQVQEFGPATFYTEYRLAASALFSMGLNQVEHERRYRQIPWEVDADMTAEQYYHLVEIRNA